MQHAHIRPAQTLLSVTLGNLELQQCLYCNIGTAGQVKTETPNKKQKSVTQVKTCFG